MMPACLDLMAPALCYSFGNSLGGFMEIDSLPIIGYRHAERLVYRRFYFREHNVIDRALVALALESKSIGPSETLLADIECALHETDDIAISDIRNCVFRGYRRSIEPLINRIASLDEVAAIDALDDAHELYSLRLPELLTKHSKTLSRVRTLLTVKAAGSNVFAIPFR